MIRTLHTNLLTWLLLFLFPIESSAATDFRLPAGLRSCGNGLVEKVLTGDRFILQTGTVVALADIKAPEYWEPGAAYKSWPYGYHAKNVLSGLIIGKDVQLFCNKNRQNYLGQISAHVLLQDQTWVQHHMVAAGAAYVFPLGRKVENASQLWAAEVIAREKRAGLWANDSLNAVHADGNNLRPGWFQLVHGTVLSSKAAKTSIYLNFGADWSEDFTIEIPNRVARRRNSDLPPLLEMAGLHVEVRGWVEWAGGPKIILENITLLRILSEKPTAMNAPTDKTTPER